ncbi:MAG: hypothetical protein COB12_08830 [Flavobacterium sp.]|nr:MAG: hypothetical protein COB12_08830 [Flavobacterium sp.]
MTIMKTRLLFMLLFTTVSTFTFAQTTLIPDSNFEQALIDLGIDSDGVINGEVLTADVEDVLSLEVQENSISDLTGIEDFSSLQDLYCFGNQLTNLNISQNSVLALLWCYENQLTTLNVTQNTLLTELNIRSNQFSSLDVTQNSFLTYLNISSNQFNTLDVTQNLLLTTLVVTYNQFSSLDVTHNTSLTTLRLTSNQFASIDISQNINLTWLTASINQFASIDLSQNLALVSLSIIENQLTSIDVSENAELQGLVCDNNLITNIDLSQNTLLQTVRCEGNQLTSLNIKNGNSNGIISFHTINNPNLDCIQVDADVVDNIPANWDYDAGVSFSNDCEYLGVNDNELSEISIYPNPTNDKLFAAIGDTDTIQSLQLFSVTGKLLLDSNLTEIDVSNLPTGMYLLKIQTDKGLSVKKVIKK